VADFAALVRGATPDESSPGERLDAESIGGFPLMLITALHRLRERPHDGGTPLIYG
jgi:hypothetical protein